MKVVFLDLKAAYLEIKDELDAAYQRVIESGRYILDRELKPSRKNSLLIAMLTIALEWGMVWMRSI